MVVYGRPEAPSAPLPGPLVSSHGVGLAWSSGADHGAAVEEFELVEVGSGRSWSVGRATRFDVVGLPNGVEVCFQVRARNRAGWSDFSAIGPCQTPNEAPGRSPRFEVVGVGDGTVLLEWEPAPVDGTPVTNYRLVWPGGVIDDISGAERRIVVSGLDNYTSYVFALTARNGHGWSESTALAEGQPSGRPTGLDGVSVSSTNLGHEVQLALSWPVAQPNGPGPVTYQVTRWGGADVVVFPPQSSTSLVDQVAFDGSELTYQITASNATGGPDHTAGPVETYFHAISPPAAWEPGSLMVRPTGRSGEAVLELEVPPSHGGAARIELIQGPGTLNTPQPNGGRHVQTISGFIDGVETAVQIRLCNELGQCSDSSVGYVTTFGQLATPTLRVWQHGSYGDHLLCAEAQVQAMGADASLTLRASNGSQAQPSQGPGDLVTEFCADAGGPELALTFTASVSSGPTTPARSNPTPATAQIKTPKDPTPPLAQPTLTTRQGGVGDTEVCATAHGHGNGHPARLYLTNDRDSVSTAPVSGSGALNSAEQCFDPGRSGVAVVFTAHLETDPTDPPRTDAPTGSVTLVSSAQPLQPPAVQARAPGSIGDYRVCASAQGDGQGTPAKLYLTSSNGATSAAVSGSGALAAPEWCVQANPAQTITFTAHLDNDSAATPRPDQTATANATAPDAPPPFAKPTITVRAASNNKACFTASAAAGDYPAQLTVSNSKNSQTWVTGASSGNLSLSESCVDAGSTASVTFTATLTSQVAGRADASASATLKMPRITASKGGNLHDNVYYIRVTTSDLPRSVTCKLTDSTYVHDFTSTISLGPNDSGQTNSRIEVVSGVWVKVRCWGGDFELTSGQIPIK
ncbi:MAG: fibronectin type III domain-containing protein [Propionibacteriaceae bacterium]|nr:fibronectin type III domain-containing protein [Propionibacteriaceae bacterium]